MDILYSEMRLRFHDKTPGEHTRALVIRMLQKLGGRKGSNAERSKARVLACIESVSPHPWVYNEKSKTFWFGHLDKFDQATAKIPDRDSESWVAEDRLPTPEERALWATVSGPF